MLLMLLERGEPVHSAVFFDTGWEFPQMHEHIRLLQDYCGIQIITIHPRRPFLESMLYKQVIAKHTQVIKVGPYPEPKSTDFDDEDDFREAWEDWDIDPYEYKRVDAGEIRFHGWGWPAPSRRWCTREKTELIDRYLREIGDPVRCVGYAAEEVRRTKTANMRRLGKKARFPLIEWGITEPMALAYCRKHGFDWGGLYDCFRRVSCFCCPLQGLAELRILRRRFPDLWAQILLWESQMTQPEGFKRRFSHDATAHDLDARFAEEDRQGWLPGVPTTRGGVAI